MNDLLTDYGQVLEVTVDRVRSELGLTPTSRVKNTITILEKLDRQGGSWLKSMHDLVGMRIVERMTRSEQDRLTERIVALFADSGRSPRVVDRRADPSSGYRAVHVIVFPDGVPVEIQIRTRWQHEWAESFEKLADLVGRDIRYGGPPDHLASADSAVVVNWTFQVADAIDAVERAELVGITGRSLETLRASVWALLQQFAHVLDLLGRAP